MMASFEAMDLQVTKPNDDISFEAMEVQVTRPGKLWFERRHFLTKLQRSFLANEFGNHSKFKELTINKGKLMTNTSSNYSEVNTCFSLSIYHPLVPSSIGL